MCSFWIPVRPLLNPPQATVMQGRPVDVDTVAKFGSMYKSPR